MSQTINFKSLCAQSTVFSINKYNSFLKSILIGNLSIFSKGNYMNISCRNVIKEIELQNTICLAIKSRVMTLPIYGIQSGIIIASFLEKMFQYPIDPNNIYDFTYNLEKIKSFLIICIEEMKKECYLEVEILTDCIYHILKKDILLSKSSLNKLSIEIVKTVISCIEVDTSKLGRIHTIVENGKESFISSPGVICEFDESNEMLINSLLNIDSNHSYNLLLFVEPIKDNLEIIIKQMIILDIKIVICQKSVSGYIKLILRRNEILVIERVGEETALNLEHLTNAIPISSFDFDIIQLKNMMGHFNKINHLFLRRRQFISICNESRYVSSLFVSCHLFGQSNNLKDIINDCLKLVYSMVRCPYVLPRSNLFEEQLLQYLTKMPSESPLMKMCLNWFINIFKETSTLSVPYASNTDECYFLKKNLVPHAIDGIIEIINIALVVEINS